MSAEIVTDLTLQAEKKMAFLTAIPIDISITMESLNSVNSLRDFKRRNTEGILSCSIKSVITPLLSDHVLREANHYLRLLKSYTSAA